MSGADVREAKPIRHYLDWSDEGRAAIWLYALAVVLGFVCWEFGSIPFVLLLGDYLRDPATEAAAFQFTFIGGLVAIPLIVRLLLGRPWYSAALPAWPPRLAQYGTGVALQWGIMMISYAALVAPFGRLSYRGWSAATAQSLALLVAMIVGFAIQTAFEELYFRGLIEQATRRITSSIPVVIGIQALFFAQLHIGNIEAWGGGYGAMLPYLAAAVAYGWAAWRTGALTMSMGMHFGNNLFLALLVNTEGDVVQSAAPFVAQTPEPLRAIVFAVFQLALTVVGVELIVRRRRES